MMGDSEFKDTLAKLKMETAYPVEEMAGLSCRSKQ